MSRKLIIMVVVAALVAPAAALAGPPGPVGKNASAACAALQEKLGTAAFATAYGRFGACVSSQVKLELQNIAAAQAACTAEQADANFAATHNGKTFAQFYGSGKNGKNALARCVILKSRASSQAEVSNTPNPAQTCLALRTQLGPAAFRLLYGTTANHRNAFGKCVSQAAAAQSANQLSAAAACLTEQSDASFAASHGGKTFAQFYGTNGNRSNAFGMCVSTKAKASASARFQATVSAAKTCKAEYDANTSAFQTKYGTFGACVAQKTK
jgi:hypothetical protein